ncbi:MAG: amidohydrolase [Actinomycetota bacterium]
MDGERPLLIREGTVFTARPRDPWTDALVIQGSRIVGVGAAGELATRFPAAVTLDVEGRTVLPGFIDAHNHFLATGESLGSVDLRYPGASSLPSVIAAIAMSALETPPGGWITGFGFDDAKYDGALAREDLDRAGAGHPVRIHHVSGHHVFVNSMAFELRGVTDNTPDPPGGRLVRDAEGHLTGACLDAAMNLILPVAVDIGHHGPNFHTVASLGESVNAIDRAGRAFLAAGLTTVCDAQVTSRELLAYREAQRQGRLPVRTVCMPLSHQLKEYAAIGLAGPFGDEHLSVGAMKFYADGSLIGGTASFTEPYGEHGEFEGSMYWSAEELEGMIVAAHAAGWQVGVHVQGDRAMSAVLDAIEAAVEGSPRIDHRHRLEHAGFPTPVLIERIARLGVITVNQPNYLRDSGDEFLSRLGERAHRLQPLRDELDAGITVVLSSDSDVTSYRPLDTIRAAMARRTLSGTPIGADQALSLEEALSAHTIAAAFALRMEDRIRSLETGNSRTSSWWTVTSRAALDEMASFDSWLTLLGERVGHAKDQLRIHYLVDVP